MEIANQDTKFGAEFDADSKTVLVFLLALIVFDLFSFEGSKTHFTGETNMYILGVCRIFFGSLPKPNIRQFGRIFCRSRIEGLFLPNSTIRQENLNYS